MPGVPGQVFNIAVLARPHRREVAMISSFSSRRAAPPRCKDARRFHLANLTFRSWVRPLTLLHERHDALLMSVCPPARPPPPLLPPARRVLPCQAPRNPICSSLTCKWREPSLLLLTACRPGMDETVVSCGFTAVQIQQLNKSESSN